MFFNLNISTRLLTISQLSAVDNAGSIEDLLGQRFSVYQRNQTMLQLVGRSGRQNLQ